MSRLRIVVVAVASAAQATVAAAADMPNTLPPPADYHITDWRPPHFFDLAGWYLRGDLGYNWGHVQGANAAPGFANPADTSLEGAMMGDIGAGIKTRWLRTDVSLEYAAPMKFKGTVATSDDVTAKISAATALFNGYLDLGTWYRITPYIGAGAGASYLRVSDFNSTVTPPFSDGSRNQWNFTWAAMAGLGYPISPNLLLDVGYRYIDFGDVTTASSAAGSMTFKNIAAHEVRVGLRWSFDDLHVGR